MINLERAYLPDDSATFGRWTMPDGWTCYTLENPWKGNAVAVSCIPEGLYTMRLRYSPVVQRTSGGDFDHGWELCDVPGRTFIMVHPGNWEKNTEGCVLVGRDLSWNGKYGPMVTDSRATFRELMERLSSRDEWLIDVRPMLIEYP